MRPILVLLAMALLAGCLDTREGPDGAGPVDGAGCPLEDFRASLDVDVPVLYGAGRLGDTARHEVPVALGDLVPAGFQWSCVDALEVRLAWTNGATAGADLYVGVEVPATGLVAIGNDEQQLAADGAHEESVVAALGWGEHDPAALAGGITVLVLSDWASLSQSGLPATITVTLLA